MANNQTSWKAGQSGNPKGRPKGTSPTAKLRECLGPHQSEIIDQLIASAKSGDLTAIGLLMRYLYPQLKPTHASITLGEFGNTPAEKARAVWDAVARGHIPVDMGEKLMAMLCDVCKIAESTELAESVEALKIKVAQLNVRQTPVR